MFSANAANATEFKQFHKIILFIPKGGGGEGGNQNVFCGKAPPKSSTPCQHKTKKIVPFLKTQLI